MVFAAGLGVARTGQAKSSMTRLVWLRSRHARRQTNRGRWGACRGATAGLDRPVRAGWMILPVGAHTP
jgi:hypothetical protein